MVRLLIKPEAYILSLPFSFSGGQVHTLLFSTLDDVTILVGVIDTCSKKKKRSSVVVNTSR